MRADGPTDRHDEANGCFSQFGIAAKNSALTCIVFIIFFVAIPTINIDCFPKEH